MTGVQTCALPIYDIIEDDDSDLALRFTFNLVVEDAAAGSAAERQFAGEMEDGYLMAVAVTLKAMRALAKANSLDPAS